MGLTIHWSFQGPLLKADALAVIEKMRQRALDLPFESVSEIGQFQGPVASFSPRKYSERTVLGPRLPLMHPKQDCNCPNQANGATTTCTRHYEHSRSRLFS
jgi:hypothetical protein